jgi:acyl carrier protein
LAHLPLTPNGKVDRQQLPDPAMAARENAAPPTPPENDLERTVAHAWAEVLQVPQVGIDENFFDLGGHSLLTLRVLGRLREATGRSLAITDMFRFPTVRALARHLAAGTDDGQAMSESHHRGAARRGMLTRRRRVGV